MAIQLDSAGSGAERHEVAAAIEGLRAAAGAALDPNDLGRLAQMHTWCQTVAEVGGAAGGIAGAVANLLEGVILKEAVDAEGGLALVREAVDGMARTLEGEEVSVEGLVAQIHSAATGGPGLTLEGSSAGEHESASVPVAPDLASERQDPRREQPERQADAPALAGATSRERSDSAMDAGEPYVAEPLTLDMAERDHLEGFIEESREHMDAIELALLEVEKDPTDAGKINELFRPFHTIKGIAGFLNLCDINRLTHEVETILDLGRKNELAITADTIDLLFSAIDALKYQISELAGYLANPTGGPVPQPSITEIMGRLRSVAAAPRGGRPAVPSAGLPAVGTEPRARASGQPAPDAAPAAGVSDPTPPGPAAPDPTDGAGASGMTEVDSTPTQVAESSIRVDTDKLDLLVDAVGELVIAQTMVKLNELVSTDEKLRRDVSQVSKIVRDVQETAMSMRMVPIGHTLRKMSRVVRDVSRKAGKRVELEIGGEETELDKNVIQAIFDPLVHMVRNAIDHGIEPPGDRRAAGKPETGTVRLNAFHQGDSIVIEVCDDGRGLDRERLIAKGIERGLVAAGETLTDQQAFGLVMQAGFSTAGRVTEISGRGVGMDVVRRNVEQLRGKVEISSQPGRGSIISVRLPLTLAIIDGMLVRVGDERVIIPTILIKQTLRPEPRQITVVQRRGAMIRVRDELITLVQLGALFGFSGRVDPARASVVIAQTDAQKIGIVVDELLGEHQVVIKSLGERFKHVKGVSGAAILGDGQVGLILEPTGLLALHNTTATSDPPGDGSCRESAGAHDSASSARGGRRQETRNTRVADTAEPVAAPSQGGVSA